MSMVREWFDIQTTGIGKMSIIGRNKARVKYIPPKRLFPKGRARCGLCMKEYNISDCKPDVINECLVFRCPVHDNNIIYFSVKVDLE